MKRRLLIGLFIALAALAGPRWGFALNLGEMMIQVRQHAGDRVDPKVTYSPAMLTTFLNEAQRDVVNRTWCLQKTSGTALTARTTYYALASDLIAIQEVRFVETTTGRSRLLEEKSERALNQENPDFERQAGAPLYYFVRHSTTTGTVLEFGVNPVPSTAAVLGTVLMDYYAQPTALSANADIPLGGYRHLYPYHNTMVYFVVAKIKMLEGNTVAADAYMKLYEQGILLMMDRLGRMPNYNPGFGAAPSR